MAKRILILAAVALVASAGCVPDVEEADTRVDAPRVLAVRAEPAEIAPRARASFTALYADASGSLSEGVIDWAYCLERKSLAELGPISPDCLVPESESLVAIGEGLEAQGAVPTDACRLFGPDRPMAKPGEPTGRPVDADPTGGYYQPLRLWDTEQERYAIFQARIRCGLPGVSMAQFADFNRRYQNNSNPELSEVAAALEGEELQPLDGQEPLRVPAGSALALRASWPSCPDLPDCAGDGCEKPAACGGSEPYVYFDPEGRSVIARREELRVSWFATAGAFRDGRTGRTEADGEAGAIDTENVWTAPDVEGDVVLWIVLRDDRGGVTWQSYRLDVQ